MKRYAIVFEISAQADVRGSYEWVGASDRRKLPCIVHDQKARRSRAAC